MWGLAGDPADGVGCSFRWGFKSSFQVTLVEKGKMVRLGQLALGHSAIKCVTPVGELGSPSRGCVAGVHEAPRPRLAQSHLSGTFSLHRILRSGFCFQNGSIGNTVLSQPMGLLSFGFPQTLAQGFTCMLLMWEVVPANTSQGGRDSRLSPSGRFLRPALRPAGPLLPSSRAAGSF